MKWNKLSPISDMDQQNSEQLSQPRTNSKIKCASSNTCAISYPKSCEHGDVIQKIKKLKCLECSAIFKYDQQLRRHTVKNHGKTAKHLKTFPILSSKAESHILPENKTLSCKFCDEKFEKSSDRMQHMMAEHEGQRFKCSLCKAIYKSPLGAKSHNLLIHNDLAQMITITLKLPTLENVPVVKLKDIISELTKESNSLLVKDNISILNSTFSGKGSNISDGKRRKIPSLQCPHCQKMFMHKNNLSMHVRYKHKSEQNSSGQFKQVQCPHCPRKFYRESNLTDHVKAQHAIGKKINNQQTNDLNSFCKDTRSDQVSFSEEPDNQASFFFTQKSMTDFTVYGMDSESFKPEEKDINGNIVDHKYNLKRFDQLPNPNIPILSTQPNAVLTQEQNDPRYNKQPVFVEDNSLNFNLEPFMLHSWSYDQHTTSQSLSGPSDKGDDMSFDKPKIVDSLVKLMSDTSSDINEPCLTSPEDSKPELSTRCFVCFAQFVTNSDELRVHLLGHLDNYAGKTACPECQVDCGLARKMTDHFMIYHGSISKLVCGERNCVRAFWTNRELKRHAKSHQIAEID